MTARRLGWLAGAAALFVGLTALFMILFEPLATPQAPSPHREDGSAPPVPAPPMPHPGPKAAPVSPILPPAGGGSKAAFRPDWTGPRVAILVTDAGDDPSATKTAADSLPPEAAFAFPPAKARPIGSRERWLSMPMQPTSYPAVNPGPDTLLVDASAADNLKRFERALGVSPPAGVTSMMGSAFTVSAPALAPLMQALKARGLPFVDARATPASLAAIEARKAGVLTAVNKRFVVGARDLKALEASARRDGRALGLAAPEAAPAVAAWAKGLQARGVLLVPPSDIAR